MSPSKTCYRGRFDGRACRLLAPDGTEIPPIDCARRPRAPWLSWGDQSDGCYETAAALIADYFTNVRRGILADEGERRWQTFHARTFRNRFAERVVSNLTREWDLNVTLLELFFALLIMEERGDRIDWRRWLRDQYQIGNLRDHKGDA